jgi:ferredoxin-NADP reductase
VGDFAKRRDPRHLILVQATGTPASQVDIRHFVNIQHLKHFSQVAMVESADADWQGEVGRCDGDAVCRILADHGISPENPSVSVMLCGPSPMISSIEKSLVAAGMAVDQIRSERYQYDLDPDSPVTKRQNARWLAISAGMLIVAAILAWRI